MAIPKFSLATQSWRYRNPPFCGSCRFICAESCQKQGRHLNVYRESVKNKSLDRQTENNDRPVLYMTIPISCSRKTRIVLLLC